jgi:4-hydroxy-2-oxoheptanedioate aldolase
MFPEDRSLLTRIPWRPIALLPAAAAVAVSIGGEGLAQQGQRPALKLPDVRLNRTIEVLESGKPVFGILANDPSFGSARAIATSGADFVIMDMEHASFDPEVLQAFLFSMTNKAEIARKGNLQPDVTPLVRIPPYGYESVFGTAKQVLDRGVMGIMFPAIGTRQQAVDAVAASRFPQPTGSPNEPMGRRGSGGGGASWLWGVPDYQARADVWPLDPRGELLLLLQIETLEGVRNINDIIGVPGVGVIFIGPTDLGLSLRSQPNAPDLETAIQTVLKACLARNVPCAITSGQSDVAKRVQQGFRMLTVGGTGVAAGSMETLRLGRAAVK